MVGKTGVGKTRMLATMAQDDMEAGKGLCVIDPHGDLYRELLERIPSHRIDDTVLFDPTDDRFPPALNLLECDSELQRHFLVQEMVGIILRLIEDEFGYEAVGQFAGPIFLQHMRMNLLLVMSDAEDPGTLVEFHRIYQEKGYWKRWLPLRTQDPQLERWVEKVLPRTDYLAQNNDGVSLGGYVGSKFEEFIFDPRVRNIFGQKRSTIDLREIMDTGKILLVNLAKGELTEANSRFLGMLLLAKLQAAALSRVSEPEEERKEFFVYVDEASTIASQNFVSLLSEGRKFRLGLILANQHIAQIRDPRIVESILNVGTILAFRVGQPDAEVMEREMFPDVSRFDLLNVPNYHAYMRTLVNGKPARPFSVRTALPPAPGSEERALEVQELSRKKYGRPRREEEGGDCSESRSPGRRDTA
jgi:DNA helicase HerA-like ATPase